MESNISNNFDEGFWRDVMYSDFGGDLKEILENMNDMIISVDCDDFNRIAKGKITNFISTLVSSDEDSFNVKNVRNINPTDCILVLSGNKNLSIGFINKIIKIVERRFGNINFTIGIYVNDSIGDYCKVQGVFSCSNEMLNDIDSSEKIDEFWGIRKLLYDICVFFVKEGDISINSMQQRFGLGFNRALKIMKLLEDMDIVSQKIGTKPRKVLTDDLDEIHRRIFDLPRWLVSF